ncbi:MAG TPA: sugar ABC transporter permease [Anaerolineaceae bacterium]|nr:sugar ABC transporter permease [Anaerolineaceae bacterium]
METSNTLISTKSSSAFKKQAFKDQITGILFTLPAIIIIFFFGLFPIGYSFYMSLYNWNVRKGKFVGLQNYLNIFGDWTAFFQVVLGIALIVLAITLSRKVKQSETRFSKYSFVVLIILLVLAGVFFLTGWGRMIELGDKAYLSSLVNTLYYALGTVPTQIIIGMVIAYFLYQKIAGKELFRMLYFLPYVTPAVSTAVVFRIIFNRPDYSIANRLIGLFGIDPLKWRFEKIPIMQLLGFDIEGFFAGPSLALITIMIYGVWSFVGYNVVIFLSGLGNIPKEVYEAAEIDGATKSQLFRYITIPYLSPITFYLSLISLIGTFKAFNHIYVLRLPSAGYSVITASVYIFDRFYQYTQFGVATSQAIVLFLIILGLTVVQNKVMAERVFYG